jgi:hypothetical protein
VIILVFTSFYMSHEKLYECYDVYYFEFCLGLFGPQLSESPLQGVGYGRGIVEFIATISMIRRCHGTQGDDHAALENFTS